MLSSGTGKPLLAPPSVAAHQVQQRHRRKVSMRFEPGLLAVLIVCPLLGAGQPDRNILQNPDFEKGERSPFLVFREKRDGAEWLN